MIQMSLLVKWLIYFMIFSFVFGIEFYLSHKHKEFFWWNKKSKIPFWIVYVLFLLWILLYKKLSFILIPFSIFAMFFILFSNKFLGYTAYISGVFLYGCIYEFNLDRILVLILSGLACGVLSNMTLKSKRIAVAWLIYLICDFSVYFTLYPESAYKTGDFFLYSAIRIVVSSIMFLGFFKYMFEGIIEKNTYFYSAISDPDHELLIRLKYINEPAYFHAVHTAYLSDKIAKKIGADALLAKALGYYHRIGLIQGEDTIQNTLTVAATYQFKEELIEAMKEYGIKNTTHVSKEAAIVQICDAFVSSLTYLFKKEIPENINYEKIVDVILKKKLDCNDLIHCELTLHDLTNIKKAFVEEKLYYDFLR